MSTQAEASLTLPKVSPINAMMRLNITKGIKNVAMMNINHYEFVYASGPKSPYDSLYISLRVETNWFSEA